MVMTEMEALGTKEQEPTLKQHQNTSVGEVERHEDSVSETGSPTAHHLTGSRTFNIKILGYKLEFISQLQKTTMSKCIYVSNCARKNIIWSKSLQLCMQINDQEVNSPLIVITDNKQHGSPTLQQANLINYR